MNRLSSRNRRLKSETLGSLYSPPTLTDAGHEPVEFENSSVGVGDFGKFIAHPHLLVRAINEQ